MAIQNVFEIDVDIKQKTAIRTPTVTQNDAVVFVFRIFDEGRIYNIGDGSTFTMTAVRPDKQAVMTVGEVKGENIIQFKLGTTELEKEGKVQAVIQVYDTAGRVSTIPFNFTVLDDPTGDYIPSEEEKTLIQQVLGEGPAILAGAQTATTQANTAAANANQATTDAQQATQEALTATANANQSATNADEMAVLAGQKALEAETSAQGANTAKLATESATQAAQEATNAINLVLPNVEGLGYVEPFNPLTNYAKNNIVRHGKNAYIALQNTKGNEPTGTTDSPYWGVLAVGGLDGAGSVVTVNGVAPDENGNVAITIPDPDLSNLATKQELTTLDNTVTLHSTEDVTFAVVVNRDLSILGEQIVSGFTRKIRRLDFISYRNDSVSHSLGTWIPPNYQTTFLRTENGRNYSPGACVVALGDNSSNFNTATVKINNNGTISLVWSKTGEGATGFARVLIVAQYHGED